MNNPITFYKKLKNLIQNECPDGYEIVYDELQQSLFIIKSDSKFEDNECYERGYETSDSSFAFRKSSKTGHKKEGVIGEGIAIELRAVQY